MARVPFDSTKKLVCVEYPGMVKDPEKVLATLGGVETISKTVADANRRLELRLRPNDVYCKPTCADRVATNHVLLRVRRKKRKGASAKTTNNEETLNLNSTNGPAPDRGSPHHASPLTSANLPPSEVDDDDDVQCSIIGIIDTTYKFQSMCDYQFLPAKSSLSSSLPQNGFSPSDVEAKGKREWQPITSDLVVRELVNSTWLDKPAPLFLPPPIFSRQDTPVEYLYRPEPKHRTNKVNKDSHPPSNVRSDQTGSVVKATSPWEKVESAAMSSKREASAPNVNLIGVARQRRAGYTVFVNFEDINVPASAIPEAVKTVEARLHDDRDRARLKHLRRLFDERPVWSKNALKCNVDIAPDKLKMMLPVVAYYFLTGPWRSLWVRLGYDPRRDPLAKKYQLVDFRIRQRSAADRICIKSKRSTYSYSLPNTVQKAQPQVVRILQEDLNLETVDVTTANQQDADDQQRKKESIYVFRHGILPPFRQMFYQLCDIFDDDVQRLVLDNEGEELSRGCTEKDGWCVEGMQDKARDIISGRLKELMKKEGIETQARKNSTKAKDQKQKGKAVAKTTTKGKTHSENPKLDSSELDDELEDAKGSEDQNLDSSEFDEVFGEKGKALMKSTTTFKGEVSCEDRKLDLSELDEEDLNFEEEEDDMDLTGFTESSERDTPMEDDEEWLP